MNTRRETDLGAHWIRLWSPTPEQRVEELNVTSPTQELYPRDDIEVRGVEGSWRSGTQASQRLIACRG